ncbi:hypothetical protein DPMN_098140 [Dreissena polymorpha]|uniref:Uncharacterized protein n=1 Tax=Dreissena polymorpha TaxID=45954 RepID=A0A9D4R6D6_DREPO|nr:hypothetical protein DPMN_098140 [Dreissena polymorpha]
MPIKDNHHRFRTIAWHMLLKMIFPVVQAHIRVRPARFRYRPSGPRAGAIQEVISPTLTLEDVEWG